jgi:hypothetical protein
MSDHNKKQWNTFCDRVMPQVSEVFCEKNDIILNACIIIINQYILTILYNSVTCKNDLYLIQTFANN